jgi:hypothetical protein
MWLYLSTALVVRGLVLDLRLLTMDRWARDIGEELELDWLPA